MTAKDNINRDLFHASDLPEEEFMKAPAIHVGTYDQAAKMAKLTTTETPQQRKDIIEGFMKPEEVYEDKIHSTPISEHAKVYPVTLTDQQANRVHGQFLAQRGMNAPPSVFGSTFGGRNPFHKEFNESSYMQDMLIEKRALAALNRNEVIKYVNSKETPIQREGEEEPDVHSYLVPSPVINMSQMSQRALPMDYSRIVESTVTKYMRNKDGDDDFTAAKRAARKVQSIKENRTKKEPKKAPYTGSLIDPDVVWPDPQLPDMWK